jgi:hypothetical protein
MTSIRIRSGGPKTIEGKLSSSKNSLKTGTYSGIVVLPGEDESQFQDLEAQFRSDFAPQDIAEAAMVHELAVLTWKKIRLEKLEHAVVLDRFNRPISTERFLEHGLQIDEEHQWILDDLESFDDAYIVELDKQLQHVNNLSNKTISESDLIQCEKDQPELFQYLVDYYLEEKVVIKVSHLQLASSIQIVDGSPIALVQSALGHYLQRLEGEMSIFEQLELIQSISQKIREKRILDFMQALGSQRAREDLSRHFYRTLAELRRHQQWRIVQRAVDVSALPLQAPDSAI